MNIYALTIVGEGESNRYLEPVLDRTLRWADGVHVAFAPNANNNDRICASAFTHSMSDLRCSADENEGMAKNDAWLHLTHAFQPADGDLIAYIKPTEVLMDPDAVRKAAKEYPDTALVVTVSHMWDTHHVRVDGQWAPKVETMFVPFRRGASYPDYRLRVGRLPTYHFNCPTHGVPVTDVLDYDMLTMKDKLRKLEWFERVGGKEFYSIDHLQSIGRTPTLRPWKKGGVLNVGEREAVG